MKRHGKRCEHLLRTNRKLAKTTWGQANHAHLNTLTVLTKTFRFSIALGDLQILNGNWYVTHSGLLRLAQRKGCTGISTCVAKQLSNPDLCRWVFKATVYRTSESRFVGYGDADPSSVSPLVRGAEMRIAETRAVNRALRKAYGIGLCSVEELGWSPKPTESAPPNRPQPVSSNGNGHHGNPPRLRDQLCLLIRQYELDPNLVKAYAAHFCGTETIKDASRDLVESFISHIATSAKEDRDGLICKLNSFAPVEVRP
jgi:hypothetical protein